MSSWPLCPPSSSRWPLVCPGLSPADGAACAQHLLWTRGWTEITTTLLRSFWVCCRTLGMLLSLLARCAVKTGRTCCAERGWRLAGGCCWWQTQKGSLECSGCCRDDRAVHSSPCQKCLPTRDPGKGCSGTKPSSRSRVLLLALGHSPWSPGLSFPLGDKWVWGV